MNNIISHYENIEKKFIHIDIKFYARLLTKIIMYINRYSSLEIEHIEIDHNTFFNLVQDSLGYNFNQTNNSYGYYLGYKMIRNERKDASIDISSERFYIVIKLKSDKEVHIFINKDVQKDRDEKIDEILD